MISIINRMFTPVEKALSFSSVFTNPTGYCLQIGSYLIFHYTSPCSTSTSGKVFDLPSGLSADGGVNFIANAQTGSQAGAYFSILDNGTSANGLSAMPFYANIWYEFSGIIKVK